MTSVICSIVESLVIYTCFNSYRHKSDFLDISTKVHKGAVLFLDIRYICRWFYFLDRRTKEQKIVMRQALGNR